MAPRKPQHLLSHELWEDDKADCCKHCGCDIRSKESSSVHQKNTTTTTTSRGRRTQNSIVTRTVGNIKPVEYSWTIPATWKKLFTPTNQRKHENTTRTDNYRVQPRTDIYHIKSINANLVNSYGICSPNNQDSVEFVFSYGTDDSEDELDEMNDMMAELMDSL